MKLIHAGTYLTMVDPETETPDRVLRRKERQARTYRRITPSEFQGSQTRIWPCLDMSRDTRKLEMGTRG